MTASEKPKTPSMTMKIRQGISQEDIDSFCKRASRITLSQVVENVVVREMFKIKGKARRTVFNIDINFFPPEEYTTEYDVEPMEILNAFSGRFPLTLKKEIANEMKRLDADLKSQIAELGKGKKTQEKERANDDADDDGEAPRKKRDDDEESEVGDGDADDDKRARQKKQKASYESDEEQDEGEGELDDAEIEAAYAEEEDDMNVDEGEKEKRRKDSTLDEEADRVADLFIQHLLHASTFVFTPSQCNFELEVGFKTVKLLLHANEDLYSSLPIYQSSYLLASWREPAVPLLSGKFSG